MSRRVGRKISSADDLRTRYLCLRSVLEARLSSVYCLCVPFESKQRTVSVYGVQISSVYWLEIR